MGLKLWIALFILVIVIANLIVFLFVRGFNAIDRIKEALLNFINRYFPVGDDPFIILIIGGFAIIIIVALILMKIGSSGKS